MFDERKYMDRTTRKCFLSIDPKKKQLFSCFLKRTFLILNYAIIGSREGSPIKTFCKTKNGRYFERRNLQFCTGENADG